MMTFDKRHVLEETDLELNRAKKNVIEISLVTVQEQINNLCTKGAQKRNKDSKGSH